MSNNKSFSIALDSDLHDKLDFIAKQGVPKQSKTALIRNILQGYVDAKLEKIPHFAEVMAAIKGVDPSEQIDETEKELESVNIDG